MKALDPGLLASKFSSSKGAARLYVCPPPSLLSLEMTRRLCRRVFSEDVPAVFMQYPYRQPMTNLLNRQRTIRTHKSL